MADSTRSAEENAGVNTGADAGANASRKNVFALTDALTSITDADYRSFFLPCDPLEEREGPAQSAAGPSVLRTG